MTNNGVVLIKKHPNGGYTYVVGFCLNKDHYEEPCLECIPNAKSSDIKYITKEDAMSASFVLNPVYGSHYHPETCQNHPINYDYGNTWGDADQSCDDCEYFLNHI